MSDNMLKMGPLAFLVDGDNASASYVGDMLAEVSRYGPVIIRRVYGNWESPMMVGWKKQLQRFALAPSQQFPNRGKKNVTDFALVIDAMDILHEGVVKGFCIVSSDSDYTSLAMRIREQGLYVIGIGEEKTHDSFRNACDIFIMVENLGDYGGSRRRRRKPSAQSGGPPSDEKVIKKRNPKDAVDFIDKAFDMVVDEDGRASMSEIGQMLNRLDPSFSPRTFGKQKLTDLIDSLPNHFTVEREKDGTPFARRLDNGHEDDFEPEEIQERRPEKPLEKPPEKPPEVKEGGAAEPTAEVRSKRKRRRRKPKKEADQQDKDTENVEVAGAKVPDIQPAPGPKPALVDDVPDDDELKDLLKALYEDGTRTPKKTERITDISFKPSEPEKKPEEAKKPRSRRKRKKPEPKPEDATSTKEPKPEPKPEEAKKPEDATSTKEPKPEPKPEEAKKPEDAPGTKGSEPEADGPKPKSRSRRKRKPKQNPVLTLLIQAIEDSAKDGRVHLAQLSKAIKKVDPEFDLSKLGKKRMTDLLKDYPDHFVLEGEGSSTYVKRK